MNRALKLSALLVAMTAALGSAPSAAAATEATSYIVQGTTLAAARSELARVGAPAGQELGLIHAVSARLTADQVEQLRAATKIRVYEDRSVATRGTLLAAAPLCELAGYSVTAIGVLIDIGLIRDFSWQQLPARTVIRYG